MAERQTQSYLPGGRLIKSNMLGFQKGKCNGLMQLI